MEAVAVGLARSQWDEGSRRFDEAVKHDRRLLDAFDAVIDDLRRRVGQTFTLEELAAGLRRGRALGPHRDRRPRRLSRLAAVR